MDRTRILIVGPNRREQAMLARQIGQSGYSLASAEDSHSAMAELRRIPADLVLSELTLGRESGVELVRMIRLEPACNELPIILMGSRSDSVIAIRALEAGADDVVRKPFDCDVLLARIARQIARASAVRELRLANQALDARIAKRAIDLGEMHERWMRSEAERRRLEQLARRAA